MTIAKLLLLLVATIAQQYALTPPNVQPPTKELRDQVGSERWGPYLIALLRVQICTMALLECSILFALSGYCPSALARPLLHFLLPTSLTTTSGPTITPEPTFAALTALTPNFLAGILLSLSGSFLRVHCYHALGRHFTFELSIRPAHILVTDGVYGIVRHPSYTGGTALIVGWLLFAFDPRGWFVRVCAHWSGSGDAMVRSVLVGVWAARLSMVFLGLRGRMNKEDAMLEKNFGEEWRAWAKRVPYRLVPGVY